MGAFDRMPISPFSASSATFAPRSPLSPFSRPSLPTSSIPPPSSTTSLLGGRIVLPRLPRRVIYLAAVLTLLLYTSVSFGVTGDGGLSGKLASVAVRTRPAPPSIPVRDKEIDDWLEPTPDGSVLVRKDGGKGRGHPIRQLMLEARQKWDSQLARQSRTLKEAVANYKLRYGRSPPRGFDAWFKFAKAHDVVIVDDYDQIHTSITPFLALDPSTLASRLSKLLTSEPFSYELQIRRHAPVNVTGDRGDKPRPIQIQGLLEGFRQWLPDDFGEGKGDLGEVGGDKGLVKMSASDHDLGGKIMGAEFRERMMDLAVRGKYVDPEELRTMEDIYRPQAMTHSLLNACARDSPAGLKVAGEQDIILEPDYTEGSSPAKLSPVSFIRDPVASFDFCLNPSLLPLHGTYSHPHARSPSLVPQLVLSKYVSSPQILITPLEAFQNVTQRVAWENKTDSRIFWRGSTTGDSFGGRRDGYDWRMSHRMRLHAATNARRGRRDVLVEMEGKGGEKEVEMRRYEVRDLNERMMDVGLSGIGQCDELDGTCATMRKEIQLAGVVFPHDALLYRYAFDIDGNGWSSRFRRLIASGNVVLKMTVFPEWNTEWLTPWLHYVPVKVDLSDLYHSATFFMGTPGPGDDGHEDLAKQISEAAVEFAEKNWRWVDMQAYMFRLLLEYRRAMAHDRDAMSMGGKMLL